MSSMRLSSLLNHLESDSEEEDTFTYEWGRSGPRYDETLKESGTGRINLSSDDDEAETEKEAATPSTIAGLSKSGAPPFFSPMRGSPTGKQIKTLNEKVLDYNSELEDRDDTPNGLDVEDDYDYQQDNNMFANEYNHSNGRKAESIAIDDVRVQSRVEMKRGGPSLHQAFANSPSALSQRPRSRNHQFDEKKDSEDNHEYDRFGLKAWGSDEVEEMSPEGHQTDVMLMTRLLSEAESQSEESMFRMALSKQDNEVTMHGSDESKGLHHQLNIHLSPEHSALTSSQRGTSGNSGGNGSSIASSNYLQQERARGSLSFSQEEHPKESKKVFNPVVFSPKNRAEMPLSAIQPYPPHVYEHNDESRTLFHRRVRKAVVAAFEDIAKERGTELTRNEYDDFLVALNLITDNEDKQGGVYRPENTQRYVLALRLSAYMENSMGEDGVSHLPGELSDPTIMMDSEDFALKAGQAVDIEGALAIVEVAHGLKSLPEHLAVEENIRVIENMQTHMRGYGTSSTEQRGLGGDDGYRQGSPHFASSKSSGHNGENNFSGHSTQFHSKLSNQKVRVPGPGEVARRSIDRWNNLIRTEQAKFDHHHTFKPTIYSVPPTNHERESFSRDNVEHHFPNARHSGDNDSEKCEGVPSTNNSDSGSSGFKRMKDSRTSEQRLIDEYCTFSPKFHTTEKAYDRMMLRVLQKAKQKGQVNRETGAPIDITVGGMYTKENGFVPGPPSRTRIPLFYYDPAHTPHWATDTYHEFEFNPDADDNEVHEEVKESELAMALVTPQTTGRLETPANVNSGMISPQSTTHPNTNMPSGSFDALTHTQFMAQWPSPNDNASSTPSTFVALSGTGAGTAAIASDTIPIAPPLPNYAWTHGTAGTGIATAPGEGWTGRKNKKEDGGGGDKYSNGGRPPAKNPMEAVLAEMSKRFKDGKRVDGALAPVEEKNKHTPGKLGGMGSGTNKKKKKKKRGAADYGDVINELQKRLARLRGDEVSESEEEEDDEEDDDDNVNANPHENSANKGTSDATSGNGGTGSLSLAKDTKVGLVKANDKGDGVEETPINTDPVACMLEPGTFIPSPPHLPASWPPVPDTTFIGSPLTPFSGRGIPTEASPGTINLVTPSTPSEHVMPLTGSGVVGVVGPSSVKKSKPKPAGTLRKDMPLPEGYYQPSQGDHKVIPHGILRFGLVTSRVIIQMKKAWKEAEMMARWASEDGGAVDVPASWWSGIDRLRRAREFREKKKKEMEKLDLRYHSDESEEEDYRYRTVTKPEEFQLHTNQRAEAKLREKERAERMQFGAKDKAKYALTRQGFSHRLGPDAMRNMRRGSMQFAVSLREYEPIQNIVNTTPKDLEKAVNPTSARNHKYTAVSYPERYLSKEENTKGKPLNPSSDTADDANGRRRAFIHGGVKNSPTDSETPSGAPTLHSMSAFERSKVLRMERQMRYQYLDERKEKREEARRKRLHDEAKATYPKKQVQHSHERILLRYNADYPELLEKTVKAHRRYEEFSPYIDEHDNHGYPRQWHRDSKARVIHKHGFK